MVLIFGGTTEGRVAAQILDAAGSPFFYSTKGNLQEIELCNGERISGAMDVDDIVSFCKTNDIKVVVDAAHPFATALHSTIDKATSIFGLDVIRYERNFKCISNGVIWCSDYDDAVKKLKEDGISNLLALTGVNTIPKLKNYWSIQENICHFRVLDRDESKELAAKSGFPKERLLFFTEPSQDDKYIEVATNEHRLLDEIRPEAIITKESGESGYFNEKVNAAAIAGVKVYAVRRPQLPSRFITVYGPVGLRLEIEKILPEFFKLRIGLTTGSTATAATKAALKMLINGKVEEYVHITLPSGETVKKDIKSAGINDDGSVWGCAEKYSGDDPDITAGSLIYSTLKLNNCGRVRFFGGEGVGTVTLPGLGLEVGGPAINNGPRQMMVQAVEEELGEGKGIDITISIPGGQELAKRTFNPKVGVEGGISVIGTSGVVRPFSKDAFLDSINREMDVAKALGVEHLVINSGAKSEQKLKEKVGNALPPQAFIHYGNFIGETVKMASSHGFKRVTLGIMIGKAVKLAAGNLDTHSKVVTVDKEFVRQMAQEAGCSFLPDNFTLARELWNIYETEDAEKFFGAVVKRCHEQCAPLLCNGVLDVILVEE